MTQLTLEEFLSNPGPAFDVRSPAEFAQGHIPGAINLPLFTNEERAIVGTAYKQQGQKKAIMLGFQIAGPKFAGFISTADALALQGQVKVYCWRGGMRSGAMAWVLDFYGLKTVILKGGYKTFRRHILQMFDLPRKMIVLGGMTGSGKTPVLKALKARGEQILDLEAIANHRGSSYGKLGIDYAQPSTEHFENEIGMHLSRLDPARPVWIEDESRLIGTCHIPVGLFKQMRTAPLVMLDIPKEERLLRIVEDYGHHPTNQLVAATEKIGKQLGGLRKSETIQAIEQGDITHAFSILLEYYDRAYTYSLTKRDQPTTKIAGAGLPTTELASKLCEER